MPQRLQYVYSSVLVASIAFVAPAARAAEPKGAKVTAQESVTKSVKSSGDAREGAAAPDFELPDQTGMATRLSDFGGKWVILYFYPKDDTPGCTAEAIAFRDMNRDFEKSGISIVGVSTDDIESHERFATKYNLPFSLLADSAKKVVVQYGATDKSPPWVSRISFLIDPLGIVKRIYFKVDPPKHAREAFEDTTSFQNGQAPAER